AATDDDALAAAVGRNVLGEAAPTAAARRLAAYVRAAAGRLDQAPFAAFTTGALSFPDPDSIPASVEGVQP
ncbi:MAG TPA: ubiquinol-cytochrome C chaperone family protein, partial [Xanthobacteraceae bacterium]